MSGLGKIIRRTGLLIIIGIIVIIYLGLGFTYFQQGMKQELLDKEIQQLTQWVAQPIPPAENLQAEYDKATRDLAPMAASDVIVIILNLARENGIDVSPDGQKFSIPSPGNAVTQIVGDGEYQVLAINSIKVKGEYSSVVGFISDLGSGKELKNMVLKNLEITWPDTNTAGSSENSTVNVDATLEVNLYTHS